MYQEIYDFKTWKEIRNFFDRFNDDWIFRGQSDYKWPLSTSIDRIDIFNENKSFFKQQIERLMMQHLQRNIHQFDNKYSKVLTCALQYISLLQHYGAPTRLLDFSTSPYKALFFAVEETNTDSAVFGINYMQQMAIERVIFDNDTEYNKLKNHSEDKFFSNFVLGEKQHGFVGHTQPFFMFDRITSQSGGFLYQGNINMSFEENLQINLKVKVDINGNGNLPVYKIKIPKQLKYEILRKLERMHITRASLFPDLEGFVKSIPKTVILDLLHSTKTYP